MYEVEVVMLDGTMMLAVVNPADSTVQTSAMSASDDDQGTEDGGSEQDSENNESDRPGCRTESTDRRSSYLRRFRLCPTGSKAAIVRRMDSVQDYWVARAQLEWQVELGADEAVLDSSVDRYALSHDAAAPVRVAVGASAGPPPVLAPEVVVDAVAEAVALAGSARDLSGLAAVQTEFAHCDLRKGARSFVFAAGNPAARLMIIGEAPGRDEDIAGLPFVGRAGQLLDKMLAAIGLDRNSADPVHAVYITNILPWRPPSNRAPDPAEIAMMLPFVQRHIALADPDIIVLMGNTPCQALLGYAGITRIRGEWTEVLDRPALPMFHPAYLLRTPSAKREAWADLLALKARLKALR